MRSFTHAPISGVLPARYLPEGTALVLEGGGTRGFYSSGVFEAFMEAGIMFPYITGVSAGAANALSYISGQRMRSRQIIERYVESPKYVSRRNIILHRSMFNFDFIFDEVPNRHIFFDWDTFLAVNTRYNAGAFDCETGETVWFTNEDLRERDLTAVIASCSVPMLCPIVSYNGHKLLDGGVSSSISIEKSIADGNDFHVIVLTRNAGFVRKPDGFNGLTRAMYRKYPKVAEALLRRHESYNEQLALCEKLEAEGRALIIRPKKPVTVGRTDKDIPALLALHDEGLENGREAMTKLLGLVK